MPVYIADDAVAQVRAMKLVEASVGAVTSLNNELFVAVYDERQIRVYHADDLQLLRCLPIHGLGAQVTTISSSVLDPSQAMDGYM